MKKILLLLVAINLLFGSFAFYQYRGLLMRQHFVERVVNKISKGDYKFVPDQCEYLKAIHSFNHTEEFQTRINLRNHPEIKSAYDLYKRQKSLTDNYLLGVLFLFSFSLICIAIGWFNCSKMNYEKGAHSLRDNSVV